MSQPNQQPPPYPGTANPGYNPYAPQQPAGYQPPYPPQQPYQQQGAPNMMAANAGMAQAVHAGGYDSDVENGRSAQNNAAAMGSSFGDKAIRRAFIKKVYGILSIQLLVTCGIIGIIINPNWPIRQYVQSNQWVYLSSFGLMMACMIALVCCEGVRRKSPVNIIVLGVFTLCEGYMLGSVSAFYEPDAVIMAAGITAAVTIGLTLFAFQTKWDFTACGGMLCGLLVILFFAGILMIFLPKTKWTIIAYASLGALVFMMYIVYDTQLMMGGKHKYSLSPEEYIFASLSLYLDIINLFMYILMIIGAARSD